MLLVFTVLITFAFLGSLTFGRWPWRPGQALARDALRLGLASGTSVLLATYGCGAYGGTWAGSLWGTSPGGADLHFAPTALIAWAYGPWAGALVAVPTVLLCLFGGAAHGVWSVGAWEAGATALLILGVRVLTPKISRMSGVWQAALRLSLPVLAAHLLVLLSPLGRTVLGRENGSRVSLLALNLLLIPPVLLGVLAIFQSRFALLRANARLNREVLTDALTGLGNRRAFDERLAELPSGAPVIMLDLDHFRRVNETHGFQAGDRALRYVGQLLSDAAPGRAYRLSNEEFALLPELDEARAAGLVEGVQARLGSAQDVPWADLTVSAGLATRAATEQPSDVLLRADAALYRAKTGGRGGLVVSREALRRGETPGRLADTPPRYSLWQAQRSTLELLAQRRHLSDADWADVVRMVVENVTGAEAGSLCIREGPVFRMCAVQGFGSEMVGLVTNEEAERQWHGGTLEEWRDGTPKLRSGDTLRAVMRISDQECSPENIARLEASGRQQMRASLSVPVSVGGEVMALLNLESLTSEGAFGAQSLADVGVFAQQIGALLQLQERWREMDTLAALHGELSEDAEGFEEHLTEAALELLRGRHTMLFRYEPQRDELALSAAKGPGVGAAQGLRLPRGTGHGWQALDTGRLVQTGQVHPEVPGVAQVDHLPPSIFLAVPLLSRRHEPLGVLTVTRDCERPFQPAEERLALMLAGLGARVMERRAHVEDLRSTLEASLTTLGIALEARDFETQGHTQRVMDLAQRMGEALKLSEEHLTALRHGAALHDIGKLCIPDSVLLKPGALTPEERETVNLHAPLGAELAARIPYLHAQAHGLIRHHHERWDGAGYPDRLGGERIPLLARVFALCDVYDALTSTRPYKGAMPHEQAMRIVVEGRGTQFDPQLTDLFARVVCPPAPAQETPSAAPHPFV